MRRRVELLDTSILVELLRVPGEHEHVEEIEAAFLEKQSNGVTFQVPAGTLIETGAHISRIDNGHYRRECAKRFESVISQTHAGETPWTFTELEWGHDFIEEILNPTSEHQSIRESLASQNLEMGDLVILTEFRRLRLQLDLTVVDLDVWTQDAALRAAVDEVRQG